MAQTEMMLRLLKDGKIVGYEKHFRGRDGSHQIFHSKEINARGKNICWEYDDGIAKISADSFELGIKVDDVWWFSGDKFIPEEDDRRFVLNFNGEAWWIHSIDDKEVGDNIGIDVRRNPMAHDKQYKDTPDSDLEVVRFGYPKKGELYLDKHTRRAVRAHRDIWTRFVIVRRGS